MTTLCTASYRAWTPGLGQPVVISLLVPKWLPEAKDWPRCWEITPRWSYFRAGWGEFEDSYLSQVEGYGAKRIARRLGQISRETGAERLTLLCWETRDPETTCHRRLWAAWWLLNVGEVVAEITSEEIRS